MTAVVLLQLWTATHLHNASWLKMLTIAYFFGSFLNHNLFLAIHELSHNLAFFTPSLNRWRGIFANLPIGVPMSITFQKYHLEHHRFQGIDGINMDIPSQVEAHAVTNIITKSIWILLQLFFYALRPLFLKPKPPGLWEFTNLLVQVSLDVILLMGLEITGLFDPFNIYWWRYASDGWAFHIGALRVPPGSGDLFVLRAFEF